MLRLWLCGPIQRHPRVYPYLTASTEAAAQPTCCGIHGNQARVFRAHDNPLTAGLTNSGRYITPGRNAAAGETVSWATVGGDVRIVPPSDNASSRVECDKLVEGRVEDQPSADEYRRRLKIAATHDCVRAPLQVAGSIGQGRYKHANVSWCDCICRAESLAAFITAVVGPVGCTDSVERRCGRQHDARSQFSRCSTHMPRKRGPRAS